jgi:ATP-dependent Clp protease adaptor protein ClpS
MSTTDVTLEEKIKVVVSEPKNWKVIVLNDDSTPMEFVIFVLIDIFNRFFPISTSFQFSVSVSLPLFSPLV